MKIIQCKCADKWQDWAPLVLRIVVGVTFLVHGYLKVGDPAQFIGFLTSLGVPVAAFFGWLVILLELIGGILLILGLGTHWLAKLFAIEMIAAIFLFHLPNGFLATKGGYEFVLLLLAAAISLMITGAGQYSLDSKFCKDQV